MAAEVLCDYFAAGAWLIWNGQVHHEPTATAQLGGVRGSMRVEDQYSDVLQNIESAIVAVYEDQPALLDIDVLDAIDALIRRYSREQEGRGAPNVKLSDRAQHVFDFAGRICEWRLGRRSMNPGDAERDEVELDHLSVSEVVLCLQRIRSSARLWNKQGGRQGYLDYVRQFLSQAMRGAEPQTG